MPGQLFGWLRAAFQPKVDPARGKRDTAKPQRRGGPRANDRRGPTAGRGPGTVGAASGDFGADGGDGGGGD